MAHASPPLIRYPREKLRDSSAKEIEQGTQQEINRNKATGKILSSKIIYKGPIFGVRRDEVLEPTGLRTTREVITHPGSVVVMPVLPDRRIILIRQYRHATRQYLWELVAGRIDPGESVRQGGRPRADRRDRLPREKIAGVSSTSSLLRAFSRSACTFCWRKA